jgi:hypothetical protein
MELSANDKRDLWKLKKISQTERMKGRQRKSKVMQGKQN